MDDGVKLTAPTVEVVVIGVQFPPFRKYPANDGGVYCAIAGIAMKVTSAVSRFTILLLCR